ncbi:MAG TPA: hypothetical protein VF657_21400 [Actinoplanes sp.]|jgi:hypothetical protein
MTFPAGTTAPTEPTEPDAVDGVDAVDGEAAPATAAPTGERDVHNRQKRRWIADLVAIAVYAGLSVFLMSRFLPDPVGRVSAHLAIDQTWFEWLLSHGAYSVRHLENPLFSMRQNVPDGVNMMANTSVLGVTIPLAPLTILFGPAVTYIIWTIGACTATAATTYWALSRHLVSSRAAAFIGGAFAGFAPGIIHHANGQPNFLSNFLLPIIVVRVMRLGVNGRWLRDGIVLGLLVAYQVFINEEMLLITAAACGIAVGGYAVQRRREARRRARAFLSALGVTALVAGALVAYPLWFQFQGPQIFTGLKRFHSWGEDLAAYVTPARDTLGGDGAAELTIGKTEQNSWFGWGLVVLILLLIVALWRRSVAARTATIVALFFAVAALGPEVKLNREVLMPGPWSYIPDDLPVLGLLMPSRLTFVVVGAVVVLLALGWDRYVHRRGSSGVRGWLVPAATVVAFAVALTPLIPQPLPMIDTLPPPQFITSGAWRPYVPVGRTIVPVPLPGRGWGPGTGRDTMVWSVATLLEFPIPTGYFIGPDQHGAGKLGPVTTRMQYVIGQTAKTGVVPKVTDKMRAELRADIRRWRGAVVVLGRNRNHDALLDLMQRLLGPPQRVQDVWLWDVRNL